MREKLRAGNRLNCIPPQEDQPEPSRAAFFKPAKLSMREIQVLSSIANGIDIRYHAEEYGIGYNTAKTYVKNAKMKLGVSTSAHAVFLACKRGLL